jgi:hypothetical protein
LKYLVSSLCLVTGLCAALADDVPAANHWEQVSKDATGPRFSPGLVWSAKLGRFVLFGGRVSHHFKGERPYDVQTFDPARRQWFNHLPAGAEKRGGPSGPVKDPGYKTPYFAMTDLEGLVAPNRRHMTLWYQYAQAPWDACIYALVCGRTLRYDPQKRQWKDMDPPAGPMPKTRTNKEGLSWGALCADPVNREVVLFGGCGLTTQRAGPGTWVYSTGANRWRQLDLEVQPPTRALSPMVFDPTTKKIVLFGGERLDQLYADTWVYDCAARTWAQRTPKRSPSPRVGHALLSLPAGRKVVLLGGKGYTSSTGYLAMLYKPLPFEVWTYDVAADEWQLIQHLDSGGPRQHYVEAAAAAAGDDDLVLLNAGGPRYRQWRETWLCRLDAAAPDAAGTAKYGVPPGTTARRSGPFDPDWYTRDVPPPDPEATAKVLENLPANRWIALKCPKWPRNRQGGGWSTVALDTDNDQVLHLGGGHSSYFGNDVAHYDIRTGRWSISYTPQFALEFNYDLSGPGPFALNLGPWGNHNYHAYTYDPTSRRLLYMKHMTQLYDPARRAWAFEEKLDTPFPISKYTTYVLSTPPGVVAWTRARGRGSRAMALFRFEGGKRWGRLPVKGAALPVTVTDGAAAAYDSKRDRLVMTTSDKQPGQVWTYEFRSGNVEAKDPAGMEAIQVKRFAREAVYLPKADVVMLGYLLEHNGRKLVPLYDCAENRWLGAEIPGAEFLSRRGSGASVDLGLAYDPKRDLVWGVLCRLRPGSLQVLRLDRKTLAASPLR